MSDVWTERIKAFAVACGALAALVGSVGGIILGVVNHGKIDTVQEHQAVNSQKIDDVHATVTDVKKGVDKAETTATEVKRTLDAMK